MNYHRIKFTSKDISRQDSITKLLKNFLLSAIVVLVEFF